MVQWRRNDEMTSNMQRYKYYDNTLGTCSPLFCRIGFASLPKTAGSLAFELSLVLAREGDTHTGPAEKAAAEAATQARTATRSAAILLELLEN